MGKRIFFKVVLNSDVENKYRQITTGLEIGYRKPPNTTKDMGRKIEYIVYFDNIEAAVKFIGGLLARITEQEQQRLLGV